MVQRAGLRLILDLHHAPGFASNNLKSTSLFEDPTCKTASCRCGQVERALRGVGDELAFELLNEIVLPNPEPWKSLVRRTVEAIRKVDANRIIVVGGNVYNSVTTLKELEIFDDPHIAYTFHFYLPMLVTHQKAPWVPVLAEINQTVDYPGPAPKLGEVKAHRYPVCLPPMKVT